MNTSQSDILYHDTNEVLAAARKARAEAFATVCLSAFRGVGAALAPLVAPLREWVARSKMQAELNGLTDAELADMGLTRGDIPAVVDGTYGDMRSQRSRIRPLSVRIDPGARRTSKDGKSLAA
ncbi:DUF1127 domain-containing protein [Telmatospirillum sp. J64-1]|uniref:DUF1127 domain-containing protein n=1 Tax=Telmatospirillum sp. J64-1 TaxID=2502183 RepID=UPI00163D8EF7|nr:DUF1127 domain-containing protein [Telmatospirillum sp. J64-1]